MEDRRRCTTVRQLEVLLEYLETHRDLAIGRVRSKEGRALASRLWQEIAEELNSLGPARTGKEWSRVWNDFKTKVRSKLIKINASHTGTGGGPNSAPTLTPLEDKVANIIGRDVGPLPNVAQNPFIDDGIIENDGVVEIEVEAEANESALPLMLASHDHSYHQNHIEETGAADQEQSEHSPQRIPVSPVSDRARMIRRRRRRERSSRRPFSPQASTSAQTPARRFYSARSTLEESRLLVMKIEELRAQAHLDMAQGFSSIADSFKLIAESIARMSQQSVVNQNMQQPD